MFGNLNLVEALSNGLITTEMGIIIRMADKIARSWTLATTAGREGDERLEDTLLDLIGYMALLIVRIRSRDPQTWDAHLRAIQPFLDAPGTIAAVPPPVTAPEPPACQPASPRPADLGF